MGLLDRWSKKKKDEQLAVADKKVGEVKAEETKVKTAKTATKKVEKKEEKVAAEKTEKKTEKTVNKTTKTKNKKAENNEAVVKTREIKVGGIAHKILIRPLVTEKAAIMESQNKYSFLVCRCANKQQVKEAVKELYGVKPVSVNMVNVNGRYVRFGRNLGRRSDYKKATVTLPAGKTITIHEGV